LYCYVLGNKFKLSRSKKERIFPKNTDGLNLDKKIDNPLN
jgi:hypothetical protein